VKQDKTLHGHDTKLHLLLMDLIIQNFIDFDEIFFLAMKMSSIYVVHSLTTSLDLKIEYMDEKNIFLHGNLEKEIYVEQLEIFRVKEKADYVCLPKKSLYDLK
jgi:hypothetical protein